MGWTAAAGGAIVDLIMAERIECVYLTCFAPEFSFLAAVLGCSGIRLYRADTLEEADFFLTVTGATVFLSDVAFLDGTWQDAVAMAVDLHPLTPCLIACEPADWPLLGDLYTRGACGGLAKPIDFAEALRMIRIANQAARDRAEFMVQSLAPAPVSSGYTQTPGWELPSPGTAAAPERRTRPGGDNRG